MATDPNSFRVSPTMSNMGPLRVPEVQNQAGQQLQQLGGAIAGAGKDATNIFLDQMREANTLAVNEASRALETEDNALTHGENGFTRQLGRNAIDRPGGKSLSDEIMEQRQKSVERIASGLHNDAQRRAFSQLAANGGTRMSAAINKHTADQVRVWKVDDAKANAQLASDSAALNWADPGKQAQNIAVVNSALATIGEVNGWGEDALAVQQRVAAGRIHANALSQILDTHGYEVARDYFNANSDAMDGDTRVKLAGELDREGDEFYGRQLGDEVFGVVNNTNAAAGDGKPQGLIKPVAGAFPISSGYGKSRGSRKHAGVDIATPVNTPVLATADGTGVVKRDPGGYGLYVEIDHGGGLVTRYGHLSSTDLKAGQKVQVRQGQVIGRSGGAKGDPNAGRSTGPHMHYEVRQDGKAVDPFANRSTTGSAGGAGMSRSEAHAEIERRAGGDRRLAEIGKRRYDQNVSARDYDEAQTRKDAWNRALELIVNSSTPYDSLPASVRSALHPEDKLRAQSTSETVQNRLTGGGSVSDLDSLARYWGLSERIARGEFSSPVEILEYAGQLKDGHLSQLGNQIMSRNSGKPEEYDPYSRTNSAISTFRTDITAAGIKIDDKDKGFQAFKGQVQEELIRREKANGGPLTETQERELVLGLLTKRKDDSWFARDQFEYQRPVAERQRHVYHNVMTAEERAQIIRRLRMAGNTKPSIADVVKQYQMGNYVAN